VILRFRSSRGVERQQMRWIATGAAIAVLGITVPLGDLRGAWLDPLVILCVPLAVAVAVLRYRLWDLDRIVSRTVAYALLTCCSASATPPSSWAWAGCCPTAPAWPWPPPPWPRWPPSPPSAAGSRTWSTAASTAAARTVEGFADRLRDQVDLDALHGELLAVVDQTMQPTRTSLWLRPRQEATTGG
jgi:hypothetical protein